MVKEFLLGDNPFIGVSHLAKEKSLEEQREATLQRKVKVIEEAYRAGATGFTFSTHPANLELLSFLWKNNRELLNSLNYHILVPYAMAYVRKGTKYGTPGLVKEVVKNIVKSPPRAVRALTAVLTLNPKRFAGLFINMELEPYLKILPRNRVKSILLHEVLTELIVAYDLDETYKYLEKYVEKHIGVGFGIETRNIGIVEKWLKEHEFSPEYIMTPMNLLGYQMAPSKEMAEKSIKNLGENSKIIAINVLASGGVSLSQAISYLSAWKNTVYAVAVGTSKPWRAKENFTKLRQALES